MDIKIDDITQSFIKDAKKVPAIDAVYYKKEEPCYESAPLLMEFYVVLTSSDDIEAVWDMVESFGEVGGAYWGWRFGYHIISPEDVEAPLDEVEEKLISDGFEKIYDRRH